MRQNDRSTDDCRRHLTPHEVDKLLAAIAISRNAARDRCLLLLMFRHGVLTSSSNVL